MKTNQLWLKMTRSCFSILVACLFGVFAGKAYNASKSIAIIDVNEDITGIQHTINKDAIVNEMHNNESLLADNYLIVSNGKYTCDVLKESKMNMSIANNTENNPSNKNKKALNEVKMPITLPPNGKKARSDLINTS